ncbi:hypothetical protein VZT92_022033 [Zoarces viviparus]|uniref:Uncharacterized protein n=1 Tax=Zoarces viviparus TaxID=48416 RepID=A0AAW1EAT3_ZOAVI
MMPGSSLLSVLWFQAYLLVVKHADGLFGDVSAPQQCYLHATAKAHGRDGGNVTLAGVKEVDLLQLLDMQSATHYNVTTTEDDRGCPAYQIGQYSTLSLPTATVFGPL